MCNPYTVQILLYPVYFADFMPVNAVGREIPDEVNGRKLRPFQGAFAYTPDGRKAAPKIAVVRPGESKLLNSIDEAIKRTGLTDGMTVSFHHHLRYGDLVLNMVMDRIAKAGIKNLRLAQTALFGVHEPLIQHIRNGVVTRIEGSINDVVGYEISKGVLEEPVVLRTHGGRARAIEAGDLHIDVAFIAVSEADEYGNGNGINGPSAFGPIGFAVADVAKSVLTEILAIVSVGAIVGVPLSYLVLVGYEGAFQEFFPLYTTILHLQDWLGYLMVVAVTFGPAVLSALPSIRFIGKMDVAKTVSGAMFG